MVYPLRYWKINRQFGEKIIRPGKVSDLFKFNIISYLFKVKRAKIIEQNICWWRTNKVSSVVKFKTIPILQFTIIVLQNEIQNYHQRHNIRLLILFCYFFTPRTDKPFQKTLKKLYRNNVKINVSTWGQLL